MAQDPTEAFEIDNGIIIDGSAGIFSGSVSPIGILNIPVGSLYLQTNGVSWKKTGSTSDPSDWAIQPSSSNSVNEEAIFAGLNQR